MNTQSTIISVDVVFKIFNEIEKHERDDMVIKNQDYQEVPILNKFGLVNTKTGELLHRTYDILWCNGLNKGLSKYFYAYDNNSQTYYLYHVDNLKEPIDKFAYIHNMGIVIDEKIPYLIASKFPLEYPKYDINPNLINIPKCKIYHVNSNYEVKPISDLFVRILNGGCFLYPDSVYFVAIKKDNEKGCRIYNINNPNTPISNKLFGSIYTCYGLFKNESDYFQASLFELDPNKYGEQIFDKNINPITKKYKHICAKGLLQGKSNYYVGCENTSFLKEYEEICDINGNKIISNDQLNKILNIENCKISQQSGLLLNNSNYIIISIIDDDNSIKEAIYDTTKNELVSKFHDRIIEYGLNTNTSNFYLVENKDNNDLKSFTMSLYHKNDPNIPVITHDRILAKGMLEGKIKYILGYNKEFNIIDIFEIDDNDNIRKLNITKISLEHIYKLIQFFHKH